MSKKPEHVYLVVAKSTKEIESDTFNNYVMGVYYSRKKADKNAEYLNSLAHEDTRYVVHQNTTNLKYSGL